jgi:hypothetical protein
MGKRIVLSADHSNAAVLGVGFLSAHAMKYDLTEPVMSPAPCSPMRFGYTSKLNLSIRKHLNLVVYLDVCAEAGEDRVPGAAGVYCSHHQMVSLGTDWRFFSCTQRTCASTTKTKDERGKPRLRRKQTTSRFTSCP